MEDIIKIIGLTFAAAFIYMLFGEAMRAVPLGGMPLLQIAIGIIAFVLLFAGFFFAARALDIDFNIALIGLNAILFWFFYTLMIGISARLSLSPVPPLTDVLIDMLSIGSVIAIIIYFIFIAAAHYVVEKVVG